MIEIRTMKNQLIKDETKPGYCFRSNTNQKITLNDMAKEFKNYNSTITEPDALSMFNIENTIVCRYLRLGYTVELPWGWIYARASGTTDQPSGMFSPGSGNHKFTVVIEMKSDSLKDVVNGVEYKQLGSDFVSDPKILRLLTIDDNARESTSLDVAAGSAVRIRGHNLRFDSSDPEQGVFLMNGESKTRMTKFNRRGTSIVDFIVPQTIANASYTVRIVTKPGVNRYADSSFASALTVKGGARA